MERRWGSQVPAAAGGDRAAFAQIYDMTTGLVYAHLVALQGDRPEGRLQEAYLQYWTQLPALVEQRSMSSVVAWLVQAAENIDHAIAPPIVLTVNPALGILPEMTGQPAVPAVVVQATPKTDV
ncbi:RNA polymerase sigma factor [Allobranchiibius sp. GilTou73]|uniref:RNA polymerase sigma factor n=1 Tax=Allobranchiibius sp. GilTou73 TaxID=2904523 RepID=UPI001F2DD9BA|nr:hypothetical protein [Allobranchiibius sp. GilTou73]UIJ34305.1 hypothetical protein LVQ62_14475 [Allobranchiibius sp. GilTou73]